MMQKSDEKRGKYQLRDYQLIQNQILGTNIIRIVWKSVRRITNEILGLKGLIISLRTISLSEVTKSRFLLSIINKSDDMKKLCQSENND